jgi:hypothetical protein
MGPYDIKNRWPAVLFALLPRLVCAAPVTDDFGDLDEERWFQVELIVFVHRAGEPLDAEQWPAIEGVTLPTSMVDLRLPETRSRPNTSLTASVAYPLLDAGKLQLANTAAALRRSSRYQPLLHVAWRQPTVDAEHAVPVRLYDGMADPLSKTGVTTGPPNPQLVGTVRVSVTRYLHLKADLLYRIPVTQRLAVPLSDLDLWHDRPFPSLQESQGPAYQLTEWQAIRGFPLQESRRMRSKVVHYLDSPFLGIVALITPVEQD